MTHSHALGLALCETILRRAGFSYFGLISSTTKRAKFVRQLQARGVAEGLISHAGHQSRLPGLLSKHPGEIAVAVAARLLMMRAAGTGTLVGPIRRERPRGRGHSAWSSPALASEHHIGDETQHLLPADCSSPPEPDDAAIRLGTVDRPPDLETRISYPPGGPGW